MSSVRGKKFPIVDYKRENERTKTAIEKKSKCKYVVKMRKSSEKEKAFLGEHSRYVFLVKNECAVLRDGRIRAKGCEF